jgi:hypothetical protein
MSFITTIPLGIAFFLSFLSYYRQKYRYSFFFMIGWGSFFTWGIFMALSELLLSIPLKILGTYFMLLAGLSIIFSLDLVAYETIRPMKLILYSIIATLLIVESLEPDAQTIGIRGNAEYSVISSGTFRITYTILNFLTGFLLFYYTLLIYRNSPRSIKVSAMINFFGGIMIGILAPIAYAIGLSVLIPGSTNFLFGIGVCLCAYAFFWTPQLAYVLPYRVIRLTIFETKGGISLFNFAWNKQDSTFEDTLFTGMLHAVSEIVNATVNRGTVKEIHMERGILLIQRLKDYPIACALITTRSSRTLRDTLLKFANAFQDQYAKEFGDMIDIEQFKDVQLLIRNIFAFIPEYN